MRIIYDYAPGMLVVVLSVAAMFFAFQPQGVKAKDVSGGIQFRETPKMKTAIKQKTVPKRSKRKKQKPADSYKKYPSLIVLATGYTAGIESTGKTPDNPNYGITYSGVKVKRGKYSTIAADPAVLPIGSLLYIPGYGYGIVADTGSAIKGNRIDLYFKTVQAVFKKWGRKRIKVYIIQKGEGSLTKKELQALQTG